MNLNRKGYMLAEIIVASVLAMSIAYYLLNLTYKFKNTNEDLYQSYNYMSDKILITKNIMNDLEKSNITYIIHDEKSVMFEISNSEKKKLFIEKTSSGTTIEYGKIINENTFDINDESYYKKQIEPNLVVGDIIINKDSTTSCVEIKIPIQSIYDDNDYSIKLFINYFEMNFMKNLYTNIFGENTYFKDDAYLTKIQNASFVKKIETNENKIVASWDVSKNDNESIIAWIEDNANGLYDLYIGSEQKIYAESLYALFSRMTFLESINFDNLDTTFTNNMSGAFYNCSSLTSLDLSNFDTSEVESMASMFFGCSSLVSLDLSNFDTSNVTNMEGMFYLCSSLIELDVSNFDTSNVTNMRLMFYNCNNLTELDLRHFDTSKAESMEWLFASCSNLIELDVSGWDTKKVTNMDLMFYSCSSLTNLDLSSFDTSNVTSMKEMFRACKSLTELNLINFGTSNVTNMEAMFANCNILANLNISNFDTGKVTNMKNMFAQCYKLTSLDLSHFNTSKVTTMVGMFNGCTQLINLNLANWNTENVINMGAYITKINSIDYYHPSMFEGCTKLITTITIRNTETTYENLFLNAATGVGAQITVNYTTETSELVDNMVATGNGNVVKGILVD